MKTAAKVIAWLLIVLLVVGAISGILFLTDGGNEDFKSFVLSHYGDLVVRSESEMEFQTGSTERFEVKYIFDAPNAEKRDYSVKIVPNSENDFEYTVDDVAYVWRGVADLSWAFELEKHDTYFIFEIPSQFGLTEVLNRLNVGHTVEITSDMDESKPLYKLVVSSYNEAVTYQICFSIVENESEAYAISYKAEYFDGATAEVTFSCQETAYAGETVHFTVRTESSAVERVSMVYLQRATTEDELIEPISSVYSGDYSFVMPDEDVTILIKVYSVFHDVNEVFVEESAQSLFGVNMLLYESNAPIQVLSEDCSHEMTFHEEVPASCLNAGTKAHYSCSLCGKNFADEEGNTAAGSLTIKALGHKKTVVFNMPATCTRIGWKSYEYCTREGCDYTTYQEIAALGHAEVFDEAITPTCTEAGRTAGSHCSRCYITLEGREVIEPLGHTEEIDEESVILTCTQSGWTASTHCSVCNEPLEARREVPALNHRYPEWWGDDEAAEEVLGANLLEKLKAMYVGRWNSVFAGSPAMAHSSHEPTCTEDGYESYYCNLDGNYEHEDIPALGHTEVIDEAVAPTCTEVGKTQGKHCSVCEEVLEEQEEISALGHDFKDGKCAVCGEVDPDYEAPQESVESFPWFKLLLGVFVPLFVVVFIIGLLDDKRSESRKRK